MTLTKALRILTVVRQTGQYVCDCEDEEALKLGIEALKAVLEDEYRGTEVPRPPLPGETEE